MEIVKAGFAVVVVAAIAQRVDDAEGGRFLACDGDQLAPRVVGVVHKGVAAAVAKIGDVPLQIVPIVAIGHRAGGVVVVFKADRLARCIMRIADDIAVGTPLLNHRVALQQIGRFLTVHCLCRADAVRRVLVLYSIRRIRVFCKPSAVFPFQRTAAIGQRIADRVIGDGFAVVCRQLVLPRRVAVVDVVNRVAFKMVFASSDFHVVFWI